MVKKGDRVLMGQLIAQAGGFVSANIHSSVSGTVKNIENRLVNNGSRALSIVIENDELYESIDFDAQKPSYYMSIEKKEMRRNKLEKSKLAIIKKH